MRRIIATMGILGLAVLGTAGTANAAPPIDAAEIHASSPVSPGNEAAEEQTKPDRGDKPDRGNWPDRGDKPNKGNWPDRGDKPDRGDRPDNGHKPDKDDDKCEEPVKPPVEKPEKPPVEEPVTPPAEEPVTPPVDEPVAPPAGAPQAPTPIVNVGYNVQTAAAGTETAGVPLWLSVLTGLLTAGAATVLLRGMTREMNTDS